MNKILIPLLALMLLCMSMGVLAEGQDETVTVELNTANLPVYAADDPYLEGMTDPAEKLPVIVLPESDCGSQNAEEQENRLNRGRYGNHPGEGHRCDGEKSG